MSTHTGLIPTGTAARLSRQQLNPPITVAATCAGVFGLVVMVNGLRHYGFGVDSLAYWSVWHHGFYSEPPGSRGAYLYSPVFAQAIWPLAQLPWPVFAGIWGAGVAAALVWLLWPLQWPLRIAALALVSPEIIVGNVWAFYAVVLVIGFRRPQAWALPLLTKVTAGMGCVWFIVRREWKPLGLAIGCTSLIACASFAISPGLWSAWVTYLLDNSVGGSPPLMIRLPLALGLAVFGALRRQPIWIALAIVFGSPVFGPENFVVLAAIPRLRGAI